MNEPLVAQARDCLHIRLISLREARFSVAPEFAPMNVGALEMQAKIGLKEIAQGQYSQTATDQSGTFFKGYVEAGVRLVSSDGKDFARTEPEEDDAAKVMVELVATFVGEYELEKGKSCDDKAIQEFMAHNAVYHVWSYWREYVQSTFARAGLANVTLPMMVFKPMRPVAKD